MVEKMELKMVAKLVEKMEQQWVVMMADWWVVCLGYLLVDRLEIQKVQQTAETMAGWKGPAWVVSMESRLVAY